MNRCVFLDRDGTINVDKGYVYLPSEVEFLQGVPIALKRLKEKGFFLIVITNQSGVARGKFNLSNVYQFHQEMNSQLKSLADVFIDAFYVCPHHPLGIVSPYNTVCKCRKPQPGLIYRAACEYNIDLKSSYMVGDKDIDIELGQRAGLKGTYKIQEYGTLLEVSKEIIEHGG